MIETKEYREKLERLEKLSRESRAQRYSEKMGTPLRGLDIREALDSSGDKVAAVKDVLQRSKERECPVCAERKRKARDRVKRHRDKKKLF